MREYRLSEKIPPGGPENRGRSEATKAPEALPCPSRTNSTEPSPYQKRQRFAIESNIAKSAAARPGCAYFLTLTVGHYHEGRWKGVDDAKEVSKRFNSLRRHLMEWLEIRRAIIIPERHKSGNWHLHLYVETLRELSPAWEVSAFQRACKASQNGDRAKSRAILRYLAGRNPILRRKWAMLRKRLNGFGFGRHEFVPVMVPEAAGKYLGKYLGKTAGANGRVQIRHVGDWYRSESRQTLGFMLVRGWSWAGAGGRIHRLAVAAAASLIGCNPNDDWQRDLKAAFGPKWCFRLWNAWQLYDDPRNFVASLAGLSRCAFTKETRAVGIGYATLARELSGRLSRPDARPVVS